MAAIAQGVRRHVAVGIVPMAALAAPCSKNFSESSPTIFCTRTKSIIDVCLGNAEAVSERLAMLVPEHGPDLVVLTWEDAWARAENAAKTEPVEINEAAWNYALNVLPPLAWRNSPAGESFKVSEPLFGTVVSIYLRLGERRFSFNDSVRLAHDDCCARVFASRAFAEPAEDKPVAPLPEPIESPYGRMWPEVDIER